MSDVDALMDLPNLAVEGTFGRLVAYTPKGGSVVVDPDDELQGDFQEHYEPVDLGLTVPASERVSALDFRAALLEQFEIEPGQGDIVSFVVRGESRTYRVTDVRRPAPESVLLILGERTA